MMNSMNYHTFVDILRFKLYIVGFVSKNIIKESYESLLMTFLNKTV